MRRFLLYAPALVVLGGALLVAVADTLARPVWLTLLLGAVVAQVIVLHERYAHRRRRGGRTHAGRS